MFIWGLADIFAGTIPLKFSADRFDIFSVYDLDYHMVRHPIKPELNGRDLSGLVDAHGVKIVVELVDAAKRGEGEFVYYLWPKPGSDTPVQKAASSRLFQPWGWVLQTGIYIDDVEATFRKRLVIYIGVIGAAMLVLLLLSLRIARSISRPLQELQDTVGRLAESDLSDPVALEIAAEKLSGSTHRGTCLEINRLATAYASLAGRRVVANAELGSVNQQLVAELAEKRRVEAARENAEQASSAKSAFLANMSHEIRTPLNAILGLTHLLGRSPLDAAQRARLTKIAGAAGHLLSVVNNILDLSKIEANKLELEAIDFSPAVLVEQARVLIWDKLVAKELEFRAELDGLPPVLNGDATRLRQALVNYLGMPSNSPKRAVWH